MRTHHPLGQWLVVRLRYTANAPEVFLLAAPGSLPRLNMNSQRGNCSEKQETADLMDNKPASRRSMWNAMVKVQAQRVESAYLLHRSSQRP